MAALVANDGTSWHFNPPATPHFGGKWEAAIKSMKHHLRRVAGDIHFTYEEFTTLLIQVEAILNSRPLMPLTDDPDDLDVLTPGHFLIGHSLTIIPEPNLETIKSSRLSRWQLISQMTQSFWTKWSREYLQRFQAIYKWNKLTPSLKPGNIVLIIDERYPPGKWPMGKIIQVHPGKDGLVRVVTLKTSTTTMTRPITKLCPLVIDSTSESSSLKSTKAGGNV
ncbi:uncharacterized protein [Chelonus insularis]|uniref:uncharacterized protein n=1 Tax=Chelonus insularis TaxID=460826 RepID=UPI00158DBB96|nr:uncharacterized protein LOC118074311 [Chelonus insularis]